MMTCPVSSAYLSPGQQLGDVTSITFHCLSARSSAAGPGGARPSLSGPTAWAELCVSHGLRYSSSDPKPVWLKLTGREEKRLVTPTSPSTCLLWFTELHFSGNRRGGLRGSPRMLGQMTSFQSSFLLKGFPGNIQLSLLLRFLGVPTLSPRHFRT